MSVNFPQHSLFQLEILKFFPFIFLNKQLICISFANEVQRADVVRKYTRESSGRKTAVCASAELFWLCVYRLKCGRVDSLINYLPVSESRTLGQLKRSGPREALALPTVVQLALALRTHPSLECLLVLKASI